MEATAMTDRIGYLVLARHPNPYRQHPWDYETVGEAYARLADAEYQQRYLVSGNTKADVEYVIGEVHAVSTEKPPWPELK